MSAAMQFRIAGRDVLEAWSEKHARWQRIAEFDGWLPSDRILMIVETLNGNANLVADWNEVSK